MPPMPHSEVPRIELNPDSTITLYVNVYNFNPGTPVEVSGEATQANGAVARFYDVQEIPQNSGQGAVLAVKSVPVRKFVGGFPITVIARATEAWITTLDTVEGSGSSGIYESPAGSGPLEAVWKSNYYDWAVSSRALAVALEPEQASQAPQ